MLSQYLSNIEGIGIYPMIALLIFFPFFVTITVHIWRMKKSDVEAISRIPLDDDQTSTSMKS
jgi:cbb3-type cytochrome oxidase subunit 3